MWLLSPCPPLDCFLFSLKPDLDAALASAQLEQAGVAVLRGPAELPAGGSGLALPPLRLLPSRALLLRLEGLERREAEGFRLPGCLASPCLNGAAMNSVCFCLPRGCPWLD